jgi:phosphatidylglycerophosphate synthase
VRTVRHEVILGTLAALVLLAVLALTVGLDVAGWVVGLAAGGTTTALLGAARARRGEPIFVADWVTLTRAVLAAGVAALVVSSGRPEPVGALVGLASVALVLDAVDGQVARRTGTANPLGARFDGEVDAFLILVLSIAVARHHGSWVLAIGAARYVLLVAGWAVPWLAAPLPPRYWAKVVAAVQGVVLTVVLSGVLPSAIGTIALLVALLLLLESFGHSVVWLYRTGAGPRSRTVLRRTTTLAAAAVVWVVLVAPDRLDRLTPAAFVRIPVEGLALVALGLLLPRRPRRVLAVLAGVAFGLLTVVKLADVGFYDQLGRPFDPVLDWGNLGPAIGVLRDSIGAVETDVLLALGALVLALLLAGVVASTLRLSAATARHPPRSAGGVAVLAGVWGICAALSLQLVEGVPVASTSSAGLAVAQVRSAQAAVRDEQRFQAAAADPYADLPADRLLTGLRGKDVLVVFVESYGQVAVQGTSFSAGVDAVLRSENTSLARAGYSARSAWLDSPTFGGISWLAHSTLQSGLWIANQQRYDHLLTTDRMTLASAFGEAGWRTVVDIPSDNLDWPQGRAFYGYDRIYDSRNVGYQGPTFSYSRMPDQYALAAFQRLELTPGHRPLMAEIDLSSSHTPWTPLPRMVPWNQVGDGSVFDPMPAQGLPPDVAWQDHRSHVPALYGESVQYSLRALFGWVTQLHDPNLVLVVLGDHQPARSASGPDANHLVPVSFVTADPAVLSRTESWRWEGGLHPSPTAPVWRMDAFRNRFLDAFDEPSLLPVAAPGQGHG